ncbi:phosphate regulon sensor histidine kinase PhoR [Stenoxybacter acetivorans]|uniref:phosphate regulon sensor histidine kinase PhoR n=1 Tax=Stenoxybacter acetivorans TaxID=422441 RepID=UPI00056C6ADD|nr:phosphate regulon sensor histidine kinase PhoR [Stenoxybacter acetivorans]
MVEFRQHLYQVFASIIAVALIAYVFGGWIAALSGVCLLLLIWLVIYWYHLAKLAGWLKSPKLNTAPRGFGVWENIFIDLLQLVKSRKKRRQKLEAALHRFHSATEAMPNGVIILDNHGRIEWLNTLAARHLNLNIQHDRRSILSNLIRVPEFYPFVSQPLNQQPISLKLALPDSQTAIDRTILIIRAPFESNADLLITQDISAAEQFNVTRTAFVANVSHELRTPLTVVNGFLETLSNMPDLPGEQQQEFIGLMHKESQRMLSVVNDLLTLSRLESQTAASIQTSPINLSALSEQAMQAAQTLSDGKHRFEVEITPDIEINGVQLDLYNAFSNLLFNAVRYTPESGEIRVSLEKTQPDDDIQAAQIIFSVQDSGPGIAAEHLPHLTDRFYRVDVGRSRQSGGTGLGLSIVKHALAEHGGYLEIDSEVGKGSVFRAVLPLTDAG